MTKKKVLLLVGGNYISGAEKVTLDVITGLKAKGYDFFCVASKWNDGRFSSWLEKIGVPIRLTKLGWYYLSKPKWSVDSLVHYPGSFLSMYRFLKQHSFDYVYTMSYRYIVLLFPLLRRNIIYHVHDPNSNSKQHVFFLKLVDRKVVRYIAVSQFIKQDLIRCGIEERKIIVVYNGVEIFPKLKSNASIERLRIGIVGQIIPRKGHEDAIEALRILLEEGLACSLIIVGTGDGEFLLQLKKKINDNRLEDYVEWRSFRETLPEIYRNIDVLAAPTRNDEPFALVALEANMLGIPVIATQTGGFPESIVDGVNGFLIAPYNPTDLASKISLLYSDKTLLHQMGDSGRKRILERFTRQSMVQAIDSIFND